MYRDSKKHILKEGTERTTLCSYTGYSLLFSEEPTCKKCIVLKERGRKLLKGPERRRAQHQDDLVRRRECGDKAVFQCQCGTLYSSVSQARGVHSVEETCRKCRRAKNE